MSRKVCVISRQCILLLKVKARRMKSWNREVARYVYLEVQTEITVAGNLLLNSVRYMWLCGMVGVR